MKRGWIFRIGCQNWLLQKRTASCLFAMLQPGPTTPPPNPRLSDVAVCNAATSDSTNGRPWIIHCTSMADPRVILKPGAQEPSPTVGAVPRENSRGLWRMGLAPKILSQIDRPLIGQVHATKSATPRETYAAFTKLNPESWQRDKARRSNQVVSAQGNRDRYAHQGDRSYPRRPGRARWTIFRFPVVENPCLTRAWDGFFSFEAERRGASRVLATDNFCWSGPGPGKMEFNTAHHHWDRRWKISISTR